MAQPIRNALIMATLLLFIGSSHADVYKWIDENGNVHYSDTPPPNASSSDVFLERNEAATQQNTQAKSNPQEEPKLFKKDDFRMPARTSKVPYRFFMASSMEGDEPADRLSSINIDANQTHFYSYVKLTGTEADKRYNFRIRIIDAKGELVFDMDKALTSPTNSIWFAARFSPKLATDEPGLWTIQGILNGDSLFIEKRKVNF